MRVLSADDKATRETRVDGDTVHVTRTARENEEQPRTVLSWDLDFSNCSNEELLRLAADSVVIAMQSRWRKAPDRQKAEAWDNVTFDVKAEVVDRARIAKSPMQKAVSLLSGMTQAEREEFLKEQLAKLS